VIFTKQVNSPKGVHWLPSTTIFRALRRYSYTLNGHKIEEPGDIIALGIPQGGTLVFDIECGEEPNRLKPLKF
jgi:phosphotransferase system HPr-like phosphotransfer protein